MDASSLETVRSYYGRTLSRTEDLRTDACTTSAAPSRSVQRALQRVHPDVKARYFGCGLVAPPALDGARILDLGCGSGQDCYVLAQLVGPSGSVIGVDATQEQLACARAHSGWHRDQFGYANVEFLDGDIGALDELGLESASFDLVVSNCVINLVDEKASVFQAAHRLLKPGGEFYFADVYADRRVPSALRHDPVLHGECLAGALYWGDFLRLAKDAGFLDPRLVSDRPLAIGDPEISAATAPIRFVSATWRLFKLDGLEPACEDYGQAVRYLGGITDAETLFVLDRHHRIEAGRVFPVCGNTWRMLRETRFSSHFEFHGDFSRHYGIFPGCGAAAPFDDSPGVPAAAGGCC